ncbi:helicase-associated domain-containing protein [Paenibacillus glycanilyticus]|uniref:helicase-associated domain-containing protein n=1 Tax=Paenibacillus glycanilyticus TaxID=126569 RepID=UPI00203F2DCD|nr:helicase-associated domain-containing protein [Paenibacillus glycanilyticus]MCM3626334.1 helicase-associated domain-containing protein [Paenibacillus glycanilyticus]
MFVKEWSEKLTSETKQQFMDSPFWIEAANRGLCWENAVIDKLSIQEAVERMDEASVAVLRTFYSCFGAGPVSEERLFSLREELSGAEFRYGLIQLQNAGIVFALRQGWGERLYAMPSDCFMLWHPFLFGINKLPAEGAAFAHWEQRQEDAASKPLGRQLLAAWAELARTGTDLTAKGILPKKTTAKLMLAISFTDEDMAQAGWQSANQDPYRPAAAFLLKVSEHLGVLVHEKNRLRWEKNRLAEWFSEPELMQEALLLQWCLEDLLEKKPAMWHIMALLARLDPGTWYSEAAVSAQFLQLGLKEVDWEQSMNSCLKLLRVFGWVELARTEGGRMLRWTMMPLFMHQEQLPAMRPEPIMSEPNGDLLVPPGCTYRIRWELELIADRKSDDQLSVWQLNQSSIRRALSHGRTIPSILNFLQAASGGAPISPILQTSLTDWGKQDAGNVDKAKLLTDGYPVLPQEHQASGSFILRSSGRTLAGNEIMNHEDFRIERFLPELERVPTNWMQQLRSYHHSTRFEIMERALSWQAPVQLSMDDAVVAFVPARLERVDGGWTVTGLLREASANREVCLTPEMWQGMKLVAPGVSGFV